MMIKLRFYQKYINFTNRFRRLLDYFLKIHYDNTRKCYACGEYVRFLECHKVNKNISISYLLKIWFNENVKLLCCRCNEILKSFPSKIHDYLIKNKELIPKINYVLIPDDYENDILDKISSDNDLIVEYISSLIKDSSKQPTNFTTNFTILYPDGKIWVPKNKKQIKEIIIEKTEKGYKAIVEVEFDTGFTIKIEEVIDKKYLIKKEDVNDNIK